MPKQLVMPFAPQVSYAAADFLPGAANDAARSLLERWPDWPYSIVLLHGPKGCGKTHLAHLFAQKSNARFVDPKHIGRVTAEQLLESHHSWVLDGVLEVVNEAALAQLINLVRARGDYLLLTSPLPPAEMEAMLPDLASRLKALPVLEVHPPDDTLLTGVLAKAFTDRQLRIAPDVLSYAVARLERSYEAVQQFAAEIDRKALAEGRAVTLPLVRQCLRET